MRIGIDCRMYGPENTTGIGEYIRKLTDQLFELDAENEYVLFFNEPAFSIYQPPSKKIKKVRANVYWYSWKEQLIFPFILLKENVDLMHFPHFNVPVLYFKKFVVTIHDITPKLFPGPKVKASLFRLFAYMLVFKYAVLRSKRIITISQHSKENIIRHFNASPKKISVIYLGFNSNIKPTSDHDVIKHLKKRNNITKKYILYVGVWRDHKNIPGLVSAFEILKRDYNLDIQLVITGMYNSQYPEIKRSIEESLYHEDIILPGFVPEEDLGPLYSGAEAFVLPSFCEGFGLVAIEALLCQTPVAGSNTTSLPEVLGDSALYFDPGNPHDMASVIYKLVSEPHTRELLKKRASKIVSFYQWSKTAEQTYKIYTEV